MKIFKFGGASVKDAAGVRNLIHVLETVGYKETLVVVSAMGKTTNALEKIIDEYFINKTQIPSGIIELKEYHLQIVKELFEENQTLVSERIHFYFDELQLFLKNNKAPNYSFVYDQVVSYGELLSTTIIQHYFLEKGWDSFWLDARNCIKTDDYYRAANLNWEETQSQIKNETKGHNLIITQGFIGSNSNNFTTTLGREGSDYSAAIFAYALNADSVTIWKDVPGVLNGDPRVFQNTELLNQISYREAIELAFYGASVIHPKTLQPLQRKEIPLFVKSFENPEGLGTSVSKGKKIEPLIPCYILKKDQVLLRLSSIDFSFIVEENISYIFGLLHEYQMPVELIQNSAISFSVCINNKYKRLEELVLVLRSRFNVEVNEHVDLFTVRHFNEKAVQSIRKYNRQILLEQRTEETAQFVLEAVIE
ncbi:aspartate kinase [Flavobacteriaceae bacterium]|jgi:aspartate kinase|nr:aspartate kinase [Flavobacteriaceae bacterium]MDB2327584.1 aspartate kinase [Flavobacteriaceae bacterium]